MKHNSPFIILFTMAFCTTLNAATLKTRIIQPPYALTEDGIATSFTHLTNELAQCDESLDLIVLPEFSDVPGRNATREGYWTAVSNNNAVLLGASAETARRCHALVFVNAMFETPSGWRNTTHAFDRSGTCVGRYFKRHVTAGEHRNLGFDVSYTREWSEPQILVLEGIRFAFMTCYDFYFYEAFANLARQKPDVIIGCSLQRSDPHAVLEFINRFCAYNTAAYLVRASVSMGLQSPVGGSSMIVAPDGRILDNLKSRVGTITETFDPHWKFLKPAGYGNPPATHPSYIEIGRRPWLYRPGGSAIVPGLAEAPAKRLCAHRGLCGLPENSLASLSAAVGLGASEIEFDLWWTKDGEIVSIHDGTLDRVSNGQGKVYEKTLAELRELDFGVKKNKHYSGLRICRFEDILAKLSCHTIMNIHLKTIGHEPWDDGNLKKVIALIDAYDARKHVYFMTSSGALQDQLAALAGDIPRCMGSGSHPETIVERALKHKCSMVQFVRRKFDRQMVDRAHAAGLRCNVFFADGLDEARDYIDMGIDTILTNNYLPISSNTGLK